jgi:Fe-S cluster assembly scaffold protein SufB
MSNNFWDYTSAIPRPPEGPPDQNREARMAASERDATARFEAWDRKHQAWLQEQADRKQAIQDEHIAQQTSALKAEKREAYARVGISSSEFEKMWPQLLRDYQIAEAGRDPLGPEKARLQKQADYSPL